MSEYDALLEDLDNLAKFCKSDERFFEWASREALGKHAEEAAAAIRALRREWQPIETAPKTPAAILVWVPENQCVFAVTWREADYEAHPRGWMIFGGDWRGFLQRPTHWMPLPTPPGER